MDALVRRLFRDESGATMVEYSILVALLSIAAIVIILAVGAQLDAAYSRVQNLIESQAGLPSG